MYTYRYAILNNSYCLSEIWSIFNSLKDELSEYGIIPIDYKNCDIIIINFEKSKIKKDSLLIKNNIDNVTIKQCIRSLNFKPEISLHTNTNIIYMEDVIHDKYIIKYLLIYLFKLIGINIYDKNIICNDNNFNIDSIKNYEYYEKFKEQLEYMNNIKLELQKNDSELKEISIKFSNINKDVIEILKKETALKNDRKFIKFDTPPTFNQIYIIINNAKYMRQKHIDEIQKIKSDCNIDKQFKKQELRRLTLEKIKYDNILTSVTTNLIYKHEQKYNKCYQNIQQLEITNLTLYKLNDLSSMSCNAEKQKLKNIITDLNTQIQKIKILNNTLHKEYICKTIRFEKFLSPEIFKFKTEQIEDEENIIKYKSKYDEILYTILNYFFQYFRNYELYDNIKHCLEKINNN